jgi:site-specific recombinase XerD
MSERVFKAVSRQIEKAKKIGSMTLFFNKHGKPIGSSQYRKVIWKPLFERKQIKDAGIRYRPLRNFRYTFATLLCLDGVSLPLIARQIGHRLKNLSCFSIIKPAHIPEI